MEAKTKVSAGGRIVIPKEIRDKLGVRVGDKAVVTLRNREVVVRFEGVVRKPVEELYGSMPVEPEDSPKRVAREWVRQRSS